MKFEDLASFIDQGVEEISWASPQKQGSSVYTPKPADGKNGVYTALIRPLPYKGTEIISKDVFWVNNPKVGLRGFFDQSPKPCPLVKLYWDLKKNEDVRMQKKIGENFERKEQNYCYAYVIKDPQRPDLEGKVVIWRFPRSIKKLFDAQAIPSENDIAMGSEKCNVFNLFEGKDFMLKVSQKGEWPDYSESKFSDQKTSLKIKVHSNGDKNDYVQIERGNKEHMNLLMETVYNENLPDLTPFQWKAWTDEENEKIEKFIRTMRNNGSEDIEEIVSKGKESSKSSKPKKESEPKHESDSNEKDELDDILDDLEF